MPLIVIGCGFTAIMMKLSGYSANSCMIETYIQYGSSFLIIFFEVQIKIKGKDPKHLCKKAD